MDDILIHPQSKVVNDAVCINYKQLIIPIILQQLVEDKTNCKPTFMSKLLRSRTRLAELILETRSLSPPPQYTPSHLAACLR